MNGAPQAMAHRAGPANEAGFLAQATACEVAKVKVWTPEWTAYRCGVNGGRCSRFGCPKECLSPREAAQLGKGNKKKGAEKWEAGKR